MKLRYTQLQGLPVFSADHALLGRVADLVAGRRGDAAVAHTLIVVPNSLLRLAGRLGIAVPQASIDVADIAGIDARRVTLNCPARKYPCKV